MDNTSWIKSNDYSYYCNFGSCVAVVTYSKYSCHWRVVLRFPMNISKYVGNYPTLKEATDNANLIMERAIC